MEVGWTEKDKRQFQHIKVESLKAGKNDAMAAELAARVVNKQRRQEGRTYNKTTSGTGNPNLRLEQRKYRELYNLARQHDISGRSKLNKSQLVEAIRHER